MRVAGVTGKGKWRVVRLEDQRSFTILTEVIMANGVRSDGDLSEDALRRMLEESGRKDCMAVAIACLARRAFAQAELRRALLARRHAPGDVDHAIAECLRLKLLNDVEYAKAYAANLVGRGMGRRRISQMLARRGIPRELADEACEGLEADAAEGGEEARARELLAKKLRTLPRAPVDPRKLRARLARFLYARGFAPDLALRLVGVMLPP